MSGNVRVPSRPARWGWALLGLVLAVGVGGPLASRSVGYPRFPGAAGHEVHGAYHVHSTQSDGRGTPAEIALAARQAGLDFVILTDHNLEILPPPAFLSGVLIIQATEESTPFGHLVALGTSRGLTPAEREAEPIRAVHRLGGLAVLAHPVQEHWPWTDWVRAQSADGLELLSGDSFFRNALAHPLALLAPAALAYLGQPLHGLYGLVGGQDGSVVRLVEDLGEGPKLTACGLDAHGWPAYGELFRTMSMHLPGVHSLPADPKAAAALVLATLRSGEGACALDGIGDPAGFALRGLSAQRQGRVGQSLTVELPAAAAPVRVQVYGPASVAPDGRTVTLTAPGRVEVEVWARVPGLWLAPVWKPWIVPGSIWVTR